MNNKKIGFICPSKSWGGLEMNVFRLALWLTQRGWEIILFGHPESFLFNKFHENKLKAYPLISKSKLNDITLVRKLSRQIKNENIHIVILHITKNFPLAVLTKIYSGNFFKLIFMQHMHLGGSKKDFYHRWLYNKLDVWIAPLPIFTDYLKSYSYIDISKVTVIPFGIELDRFTVNRPEKITARRILNLPIEESIIGMVGRLDEKKCQHVLIEACAKVHQAGHKIHILLIGDRTKGETGSYAEYLQQLTGRFNLMEYVHFRESLKEIEYAYAAMDIFSLTTGSETYGMVTIEAMASQLPVIVTDEGGSKDIIQHDINGLQVKPLDANGLAKEIINILTNKEKADRLASQAHHDSVNKYSHLKQCEQLEKLFNQLA